MKWVETLIVKWNQTWKRGKYGVPFVLSTYISSVVYIILHILFFLFKPQETISMLQNPITPGVE